MIASNKLQATTSIDERYCALWYKPWSKIELISIKGRFKSLGFFYQRYNHSKREIWNNVYIHFRNSSFFSLMSTFGKQLEIFFYHNETMPNSHPLHRDVGWYLILEILQVVPLTTNYPIEKSIIFRLKNSAVHKKVLILSAMFTI